MVNKIKNDNNMSKKQSALLTHTINTNVEIETYVFNLQQIFKLACNDQHQTSEINSAIISNSLINITKWRKYQKFTY